MAVMLPGPLLLVFVGTLGIAMTGGTLKDFIALGSSLGKAFTAKVTTSEALIDDVVTLAERARREGLLALEDAIKGVEIRFLKKPPYFAIDGTDPEELR